MKRILLLSALLWSVPALAGQPPVSNWVGSGNTSSGATIDSEVGTCSTCVAMPVTTSSAGGAISTKPDASVSTGYQQVIGLVAATTITPGAGSTYCVITTETQNVRYRDDGAAPTAAVGMLLLVGQSVTFRLSSFSALQFIQVTTTATLDIDCYKDA